jgi:phage shock protein PspC (stress-responsive transcriptional regulator)
VGGVGAGLAALTRLPVGWIRAGLSFMVLGTKFCLGLGIYAVAALVVPHGGGGFPGGATSSGCCGSRRSG